jgi:hypothetical protein
MSVNKKNDQRHALTLQLLNLFIFKAIELICQCVFILEELDVLVSFKYQVFDIPTDEHNLLYASANLTYGRCISVTSSLLLKAHGFDIQSYSLSFVFFRGVCLFLEHLESSLPVCCIHLSFCLIKWVTSHAHV